MAELVIANIETSFEPLDIIKAYKNGYYRKWKGKTKKNTFILRMPFVRTREIKRLFIHSGIQDDGRIRRLFRISSQVNKKNKPVVTRWCINSAKWIRCK